MALAQSDWPSPSMEARRIRPQVRHLGRSVRGRFDDPDP
jgi:hypothetical protein